MSVPTCSLKTVKRCEGPQKRPENGQICQMDEEPIFWKTWKVLPNPSVLRDFPNDIVVRK